MANVGTAAAGKTLIGAGNGSSPTYASIGTNSGLTARGVVIAEGNGAFQSTNSGTADQVLTSNGSSADPSFKTVTDLRVAKWIVNANGASAGANQTTIGAALTAASSGDTIFITPGTYTENITLKAGVNLCAFECDSSLNANGNVIISGKCTMTTQGTVTISGVQLKTNGDNFLEVTGSTASIVNLTGCYLNCTNNTGITLSSSGGATIIINNCFGNIGTTGISLFNVSSSGVLNIFRSFISNSGSSTTASTLTNTSNVSFNNCYIGFTVTTALTAVFSSYYSRHETFTINTVGLTIGGTTTHLLIESQFSSGSASCVTIGTGSSCLIMNGIYSSSNTNCITGAGTIQYSGLSFSGSSTTINTTSQTISGTLQGSKNTQPTPGMLGEPIRNSVVAASAVTLSTGATSNITSISLTAGIWDISAICSFNGTVTGTNFTMAISTTNNGLGTPGDTQIQTPYSPTAASDNTLSIPAFRVTISSTTLYYLNAFSAFTVGTCKAYGRISAVRVG